MLEKNFKNTITTMSSNPKSNILTSKGFTLIELLVVIAIIGILSSIVLSSMWRVRELAYFVKVLLKQKKSYVAFMNL